MNKIKTAVVGVGYLGKFHAEKYAQLSGSELTAVCDIDPQTVEEVSGRLGVEGCTDHRDLAGRVEAVSIAVPTPLHFEVSRFFLENGVHILLEKPITATIEEAEELIRAADEKGLVFQVGHLERFNSALVALLPFLNQPRFIESYRISPFNPRGTDVDVVLDLMIHDIDLIQSMIGSPIRKIDANGVAVISEHNDIANARIRFQNDSVANVTASRVGFKSERKMRIFQPDAYISVDFQEKKFAVHRQGEGEMLPGIPQITRKEVVIEKGDALRDEIESFLNAVREGTPPVVSGEDGKRALATALEITEMVSRQFTAG